MKPFLELLASIEGHAKRQWLKLAAALATLATGWLAARGLESLTPAVTTFILALAAGLFELAASKLANERRKLDPKEGEVFDAGEDGSGEYWGKILDRPPLRPIPGELPKPEPVTEIIIPRTVPLPTFPTPQEIAETEAKLSPPNHVVMWTDKDGKPQEQEFPSRFDAVIFRNQTPGATIKTEQP